MEMASLREQRAEEWRRASAVIDATADKLGMPRQILIARVMLWFADAPALVQLVILQRLSVRMEARLLADLLDVACRCQGLTPESDADDVARHTEAMLAELIGLDGLEQARTGWRLRDMLSCDEGG